MAGVGLTTAIGGGLTAGLGAIQYFQAKKALKQLNKTPLPRYGLVPQLEASIRDADAMRGTGFTTAERNSFVNDVTQQGNVAYNRAFSQSPNLSNAISAAIGSMNNNAYLKYAAMDAQRRADNVRYSDRLRTNYQDVANRNTAMDVARRDKAETAWGQAGQAGLNNIVNGITLGVGAVPPIGKKKPMGYGYDNGEIDLSQEDNLSNAGSYNLY